MINFIFKLVANTLRKMAKMLRLTYNEINIIVYYFLIPLSWCVMVDYYFDTHKITIAFSIFCLGFRVGCNDFESYSDWLFYKSAVFLNSFNRFGSNYYSTSVWICVALPLVIYGGLIYLIVVN